MAAPAGHWQGGSFPSWQKQVGSSDYSPENYARTATPPPPPAAPQPSWWSGVLNAASNAGNYIKNEASFAVQNPGQAAINVGKGLASSEIGLYHTVNDVVHGADTGKTPLQIAAEIGGVALDAATLGVGAIATKGLA